MLNSGLQITLILIIVIFCSPFLGEYLARTFLGQATFADRIFLPLEQRLLAWSGINAQLEMTGGKYLQALLFSNGLMAVFAFLFLYFQEFLPLNPTGATGLSWDLALHTAIAFVTNTDQQHYSGETTLSHGSQVFVLGFLFFTSAATGIAVSIAFIRGLTGRTLGNFYQDLLLSITRLLLPLSLIGGFLLLISGVPETLMATVVVPTLEDGTMQQAIALGPVAHFESIKILGENGGGFFGANSAHPFENPNGFTNALQMVLMLLIPSALIHTYGIIANNRKQAWLVYGLVFSLFLLFVVMATVAESQGNPIINQLLGSTTPNLEGKEVRFGAILSAFFGVTSTATMTGAVNGMHDSMLPLTLLILMGNLFLQIIWGGQGTGTAFLFCYLILTVFVTGLMVGRTPEFLGRKIEKQEVVLTSLLLLLIHPIFILIPGAIALAFPEQLAGFVAGDVSNFHGLAQVIYEYASAAANNGSGMESLPDNTVWWNVTTSLGMLAGRFMPIVALLLLADGLSQKTLVPETKGTLRTDTVLFTGITGGILVIMSALTFFPVLALGAIAEFFQMGRGI